MKFQKTTLITSPENVFYFSGAVCINNESLDPYILISKNKKFIFQDKRGILNLQKQINKNFKIISIPQDKNEFAKIWQKILKKENIKQIFYESNHMRVQRLENFKKISKNISFKKLKINLENFRSCKKNKEIKIIKKAVSLTDELLEKIIRQIKIGISEIELVKKIKIQAIELSSQGVSFEPIVAFGKNSACPHHEPGAKKLKKGDIILLDFGIKYKGYCADLTRTFFTSMPNQRQVYIYNLVLKAQKFAQEQIKTGMTCNRIYNITCQVLGKEAKYFSHGLGHGLGIKIHEKPFLRKNITDKLESGQIFTIEPGLYYKSWGGIRIEDICFLEKNKLKILTKSSKKIKNIILKI